MTNLLINNKLGMEKTDRFNDKKVPQIAKMMKQVKGVVVRKNFRNKIPILNLHFTSGVRGLHNEVLTAFSKAIL